MSELLGPDVETLFSNWPDQFLNRPPGTSVPTSEWTQRDPQLIPIPGPIFFLEDGSVAYQNETGQYCILRVGTDAGTGDTLLSLPPVDDAGPILPPLSDAAIKSMLVPSVLDAEPDPDPDLQLGSVGLNEEEEGGDDVPLVDEDLRELVSFRCPHCPYSSTDVPDIVNHTTTEHQDKVLDNEDCDEMEDDPEPIDVTCEQDDRLDDEIADDIQVTERVIEHEVYLCSDCKHGFMSILECREHMIKDHNMVLQEETEEVDGLETNLEELPTESEPSIVKELESVAELDPKIGVKLESVNAESCEEVESPSPLMEQPVSPPSPTATPPPPLIIQLPKKPPPKPKEYDPDFEARPHKCLEASCPQRFRSLSSLDAHTLCHTQMSDETRRFCCTQCSAIFLKWAPCALHLWKEHGMDVDLYTCNICLEYKTTTRGRLEHHMKIHSDDRPHKCSVCDKAFKQRTQLVNHFTYHKNKTPDAPKWYMKQKCEICQKMYSDSKSLKKHMQAVHSKIKPYKCNICGHMSARKAMLQAHVRQHTGEKPFVCDLCNFRTGDHNSLRRHLMRHTGKRPYKCEHCPYEAIQSSSFKSHLLNKHPGLSGAYNCSDCGFMTINLDSYEKHLSDHRLNLITAETMEKGDDVEVFPENVAAAHLVYRSLGASPSRLRCDVTASSTSRDGMKQTITISIPQVPTDGNVTDDDDVHCFLADDEVDDTGGITIPAEPSDTEPPPLICFN